MTNETKHVLDASMLRDVYSLNSPHGPIIVWESLYPQDRKDRYRYVVTLDGRIKTRLIKWFETCGFFAGMGSGKSEAIIEAQQIFDVSRLVAHERTRRDPVLQKKRHEQWEQIAEKFRPAGD